MSKYISSQSTPLPEAGETEVPDIPQAPLSRSFKKSQFLLRLTIDNLFRRFPLDHVLFVTLTFPRPVRSVKEAQRRLNSLLTNKVRPRYRDYLWVLEPHAYGRVQSRGGVHFHLLIPVAFDTHTGTDLDAWRSRDFHNESARYFYASMTPRLREEATWLEAAARRCGFGRVEVAPVHSNAEAIHKYLTKQDWRFDPWPFEEKKSFRFWGRSTGLSAGSVKFSWNSPRAQASRDHLRDWAHQHGCESMDDLPRKLGKRWGYKFILDQQDQQAGGHPDLHVLYEEWNTSLTTRGRASGRRGVSTGASVPPSWAWLTSNSPTSLPAPFLSWSAVCARVGEAHVDPAYLLTARCAADRGWARCEAYRAKGTLSESGAPGRRISRLTTTSPIPASRTCRSKPRHLTFSTGANPVDYRSKTKT